MKTKYILFNCDDEGRSTGHQIFHADPDEVHEEVGERAFREQWWLMKYDDVRNIINNHEANKCEHPNINWDKESDEQKVRPLAMATDEVTHYYECPDCEEMVEGGTEGGV